MENFKGPDPDLGFAGNPRRKADLEKVEVTPHIPLQLSRQEYYKEPQIIDERNFLYYGKPIESYEKEIAEDCLDWRSRGEKGRSPFHMDQEQLRNQRVVRDLCSSLGRTPTPAEVACEWNRRLVFYQVEQDFYFDMDGINKFEIFPQQEVIEKRKHDFPAPEKALEAFRDGDVKIEEDGEDEYLYISVPNQDGKIVKHPVMTTRELPWVKDSAKMIAQSLEGKENKRVFIGGLGLGLLNKELAKLGITNQVIAELNPKVINLVGEKLKRECPGVNLKIIQGEITKVLSEAVDNGEEFGAISIMPSAETAARKTANLNLEIREGDFKKVLEEAIEKGELFDAISIDAFPNTADEVNRDGFNDTIFELAYKALKPGGIITFYPDSRYLPLRIIRILHKMGVPDSSIHYTVSKFETDDFTKEYHYGELMAVPAIQKPMLDKKNDGDWQKIKNLIDEYNNSLDQKAEEYIEKHLSKRLAEAA